MERQSRLCAKVEREQERKVECERVSREEAEVEESKRGSGRGVWCVPCGVCACVLAGVACVCEEVWEQTEAGWKGVRESSLQREVGRSSKTGSREGRMGRNG